MTDADRFLAFLKANPTLLPAAVAPCADAAERRLADETHTCLRCGCLADRVFLALSDSGQRWLDLCADCTEWLHRGATPRGLS